MDEKYENMKFSEIITHLNSDEWSNNACMGYVIKACIELEISKSDISAIVKKINKVFDRISIEDAEKIYLKFL